jgi:hypothetical protein
MCTLARGKNAGQAWPADFEYLDLRANVLTQAGAQTWRFAMSEEIEKARAQLVEVRRLTIEALAKGKGVDTQVELLLKIQSGIDVLDSLMAEDEDEEEEEE